MIAVARKASKATDDAEIAYTALGIALQSYIERRRGTSKSLALELGVSPAFISDLKNGNRKLGPATIVKIANLDSAAGPPVKEKK